MGVKRKGDAKVAKENVGLVGSPPEQDVRRLDVAVNNTLRVDILKDVKLTKQ